MRVGRGHDATEKKEAKKELKKIFYYATTKT